MGDRTPAGRVSRGGGLWWVGGGGWTGSAQTARARRCRDVVTDVVTRRCAGGWLALGAGWSAGVGCQVDDLLGWGEVELGEDVALGFGQFGALAVGAGRSGERA